jgi:hypothetical protein
MLSSPDWGSASASAYFDGLNPAEIAWEFLRRNPEYQRDYHGAISAASGEPPASFLASWGLRFPFRSGSAGRPSSSHLAVASCLGRRYPRAGAARIPRGSQHRPPDANI